MFKPLRNIYFIFLTGLLVFSFLNVPEVGAWSVMDDPVSTVYLSNLPSYYERENYIAFDSSGNFYITDGSYIVKLNSAKEFVTYWGGVGTGDGKFGEGDIRGIAVDSANNVYVVDGGNRRIQKFNSAGNYITQWGSLGAGDGQFNWPIGIAVDSSNNVYVTDTNRLDIQKFTSSGTFVSKIGVYDVVGSSFFGIQGLAIDSNNMLWVADQANDRILKFNSSLVYQSNFGTTGTGDGQFTGPAFIAVDSSDNIYVLDGFWSRNGDNIQKFDNSGNHLLSFASEGSGDAQYTYGNGIAVDSAGKIYAGDDRSPGNKIFIYSALGVYESTMPLTPDPESPGAFDFVMQMDTDSSGNILMTDGDRVLKFNSSGQYLATIIAPGTYYYPSGIAVLPNDDFYIVDTNNNRVRKYNPAGTLLDTYGATGTGNGQFQFPYALAIDSTGNIYVADITNNNVQKFDSSMNYLSTIEGNGTPFNSPEVIAVDSSDNLYVMDSGNNRVQKFNSAGVFQLEFTGDSGAWDYPEGMTVDAAGYVYVVDSGNGRVQIFNSSGVYQKDINLSEISTYISYLTGIYITDEGVMFLGDSPHMYVFNFDRVEPGVTIDTFPSDTTTDTTPSITGDVVDSLTTVTEVEFSLASDPGNWSACAADDGTFNEANEAYTCSVTSPLPTGNETVYIRSTDSKTNTSGDTDNDYAFTVAEGATVPTVTSDSVTGIISSAATVNGNVISDGGSAITERGAVYSSTSTTPTLSDTKQVASGTTGAMTFAIVGLESGTHYYLRAYATNAEGTAYGSVIEFDTPESAGTSPTVTTGAVSSIGETAATVAGDVTSDGGETITERGIVFSSSNNTPTTANGKFTAAGTTGAYTATLTGLTLNTTYYARAYAINSEGTSYGSVVTFKTLEPAALRSVYFTFSKFRYNKYASPTVLRSGDTAYIKNYNTSKIKLIQVFLYDYAKKGNQGFTKSRVTTTSMFLRTSYNLATGKRYAYVMKFQDKATGIVATKYFVVYTTKTWNGQSTL
ncbi:MAG: hypothetical protein ACOYT9_02185 [Patescibacteria group bacterium]